MSSLEELQESYGTASDTIILLGKGTMFLMGKKIALVEDTIPVKKSYC